MERRRVQAQVEADAVSVRRQLVLHRSKNKRDFSFWFHKRRRSDEEGLRVCVCRVGEAKRARMQ
jgi:hypothetical protein